MYPSKSGYSKASSSPTDSPRLGEEEIRTLSLNNSNNSKNSGEGNASSRDRTPSPAPTSHSPLYPSHVQQSSDLSNVNYGGTAMNWTNNSHEEADAVNVNSPLQPKSQFEALDERNRSSKYSWVRFVAAILIVILAIALLLYFFLPRHPGGCSPSSDSTEICDLLCSGIILQTIQFSGMFNDSKEFVDMPLKQAPECVAQDFNDMQDYSKASLKQFVARNFDPACSDMQQWLPPDFMDTPPFLDNISDPILREWANDVNDLWNLLGKEIKSEVYSHRNRHTLLPLKTPHMIVPGGRFCEFYYWDSYWIIIGLLVSGMHTTAKMIVENFIGLVEDFGFVPNGSRRYYLNRSQPPMLSLMVQEIYSRTNDKAWLSKIFPALETEYNFWMQPGGHYVSVTDHRGNTFMLNRYYTNSSRPRPESYVADEMTAYLLYNMTKPQPIKTHQQKSSSFEHDAVNLNAASAREQFFVANLERLGVNSLAQARAYQQSEQFRQGLHFAPSAHEDQNLAFGIGPYPDPPVPDFSNNTVIERLFSELAAAAESGMDFSSRWFHDRANLTSVETMDLIPVDLNAILFKVETLLSYFANELGISIKQQVYAQNAEARKKAIHAILWVEENSQWQDYHVDQKYWKNETMVSNFIPLWAKCYDTSLVDEGAVVSAFLQSGLIMDGGIVTTLNNNTQQWDYPNAWAPMQWFLAEGLRTSNYTSSSTGENFRIYNSSALANSSAQPPPHSCDVIRPETWYNCTGSESDWSCTWCFPPGPDLSKALSLRWIYGNFMAYNTTGYMLEKYFAPILGNPGSGGEYQLQKGFGWTNGVALDFVTRYGQEAKWNATAIYSDSYPYDKMAVYADAIPSEPSNPLPPKADAATKPTKTKAAARTEQHP